ncbi:hypothetical protein [Imtechella halotolerans]|uniref:Membrane or secreted protein n=1 Tax=Imtechella halotolerans K1 TaxID=946077 RepID=I0W7N8_9FLAO|nr:hypothetical protein [Imtechella halotolerans]EID72404.1 hypothetical protein W5A_12891 [Imtechella halotolerans K1]WMQ64505.1 hypothetical protein PT603_05860 [Imtechella halotolerans]
MKSLFYSILLFTMGSTFGQTLEGAWLLTHQNETPVVDQEIIALIQNNYIAIGAKDSEHNFLFTYGGSFKITSDSFSLLYDFNTLAKNQVGTIHTYSLLLKENILTLTNNETHQRWKRISSTKNELTHNWVITGRQRNGEMNKVTPGDRRTIKILSGGRFQWVAFNSATGDFSGTGGGTYSAVNGIYTENITFFSRDNSRVGAELSFEFAVKNGDWHHSGKSSKGDPIYEIWSPYTKAYKVSF